MTNESEKDPASTEKEKEERRTHRDKDEKRKDRSGKSPTRGSDKSSIRSQKTDKSQRSPKRDRKDREAKDPAFPSLEPLSPGAVSSKGEHGSHQLEKSDRSEKEHRKDRSGSRATKPGVVSSTDDSKVSSKAHSSGSSTRRDGSSHHSRSTKPGVVSSTDDSKVSRKARSGKSPTRGDGSSHRTRDDHKKDRNRARANKPGAVSSTDDSKISKKARSGKSPTRDDKHAKDKNRPTEKASGPGAVASASSAPRDKSEWQKQEEYALNTAPNKQEGEGEDEFAVFATIVEDDEEEQRRKRAQILLENEEARIRQEQEEAQRRQEQQQAEELRQRKKKNRTIMCAVFCLVLIVAGVVGALFGAGTFSPAKVEGTTNNGDTDKTTSSPVLPVTLAPSDPPSSPPTFLVYGRPSLEQCVFISLGLDVDGQEALIEKNFNLKLELDLLSSDTDSQVLVEDLGNALQQVIASKLTGCDEVLASSQGRKLRGNDEYKYIIGNAIVGSVTKEEGDCEKGTTQSACSGISVDFAIYVQGDELRNLDYISRFYDALTSDSIVIELGLGNSVVTMRVISVIVSDPTQAPTIAPSAMPSSQPASSPSRTITASPTKSAPTTGTSAPVSNIPSLSPTIATPSPTRGPSVAPSLSLFPSIQPAPGITRIPTVSPSIEPSSLPSSDPSLAPSMTPSMTPSDVPSDSPSIAGSDGPTGAPSARPSARPSAAPSRPPSQSPFTEPPSQSPTMCPEPLSTFGPQLTGFCITSSGADQNSGVIRLMTGDFGHTQESKELCLEACACYDGAVATGCEMIWGQGNKGCYVHTQQVSRGQGSNLHWCHIAIPRTPAPTQAPTLCPAPLSSFGPQLTGYCVTSSGADQNSGVVLLMSGDFGHTQQSKDLCLEACSCYQGAVATGCEMIWGQYNRGCYVHTQQVSRGQGSNLHWCHIAIPPTPPPTQAPTLCPAPFHSFGPQLTGYCVTSSGADQNTAVIRLMTGDFGHTQESKDLCLEACACYEGTVATGCEMIWGQGNKGCYVHTQQVSRGQGSNLHWCHIAV